MVRTKFRSDIGESGTENTIDDNKEQVDMEVAAMFLSKQKSKRRNIFLGLLGIAAVLLLSGYLIYRNTPAQIILRCFEKAEQLSSGQDYSGTVLELQRVLELDENNIRGYLDISQAYLAQDMDDKAIESLQTGYDITGDGEIKTRLDGLIIKSCLERGNTYLSDKEYKEAAEEFQKALDMDKTCIEAYIGKADSYNCLNENDNACSCLQAGIDETDDEQLKTKLKDLKITLFLDNAGKLFSQNEYDLARKEFKNVLIIDSENVEAYLGMANSLLAMKNEESAVEILTVGYEKTNNSQIKELLNETQVSLFLKSAEQYLADEKYDLALGEYKKVIEVDDKCIEAYLGCAVICDYNEQIDEAVEILQTGFDKTSHKQIKIKLDEHKTLQCLNNAEKHLDNEEYEEAKSEYENALELDEKCVKAYVGLADYFGRMGQQEKAEEILEKGYEKTEDEDINYRLSQIHKSALLWQASSNYEQGGYSEAVEVYYQVLEIDPYCTDAYLGIANSYVNLDKSNDAIDVLQTGYNYTGSNAILSKLIYLKKSPHLYLAGKYLSSGDYSNAAEEYRTVLKIDYYCTEAYIGLAEAYVKLGRLSWADEVLVEGYDATGNKEIETKLFEERLNHTALSPQTTSYEPLNSLVRQILSQITSSNMSTYQKVLACYDYLVDNCEYSQAPDSYYDSVDMSNERLYAEKSAYAILDGFEGICINYSAAFAAMTRALGLKTQLRTGMTVSRFGGYTSHTWCEITLNGVVYIFDPQVDDGLISRGDRFEYSKFCRTYSEVYYSYIPEAYLYMF